MHVRTADSLTLAASVCAAILCSTLGCSDDEPRLPAPEAVLAAETPAKARPTHALSEAERGPLELLGYINLVPVSEQDAEKSGVTLYDRDSAFTGLNFFNERHESVAKLMDMDGSVRHRWESKVRGETFDAFQRLLPAAMPAYMNGWNHVELLEDGGILAIGTHHSLLRLDRDSKLQWKLDIPAHHDVSVGPNGNFYVLVDGIRSASVDGRAVAFQDNLIYVISPSGEVLRTYSLYDGISEGHGKRLLERALRRVAFVSQARLERYRERARNGDEPDRQLAKLYAEAMAGDDRDHAGIKNTLFHNRAEDVFHSNSVQVLHRAEPGLWRAGDLLISILRLDMIAVLDQDSGKLIWSWGRDQLQNAHHATQLENGEILIFDNGSERRYSRILRVEPASGKIVWRYQSDPPSQFFSDLRGGCQALPNGNLLVANTDSGQAFEVDPEGRMVWEYFTEVVETRGGEKKRAAIYRITRLAPGDVASWLDTEDASTAER